MIDGRRAQYQAGRYTNFEGSLVTSFASMSRGDSQKESGHC